MKIKNLSDFVTVADSVQTAPEWARGTEFSITADAVQNIRGWISPMAPTGQLVAVPDPDSMAEFKANPFPMPNEDFKSVVCDNLDKAITIVGPNSYLVSAARAVRSNTATHKRKIANQAKTITERETVIRNLKQQIADMKTGMADLDRARSDAKQSNIDQLKLLAQANTDLQNIIDKQNRSLTSFEEQVRMIVDINGKVADERSKAQDVSSEMAKIVENQATKLKELRDRVTSMEKEAQSYIDTIDEIVRQRNRANVMKERADQHCTMWRDKVDELYVEVTRLKNELALALPVARVTDQRFPPWMTPPTDWHFVSSDHDIGNGEERVTVTFAHVKQNLAQYKPTPYDTMHSGTDAAPPVATKSSYDLAPGCYTIEAVEGNYVRYGSGWYRVVE